MNEALLPCPFCGSTKLHTEDVRDFISCLGCGAEGPFRMGQGSESSIEAWNKRAALHADQARDAARWRAYLDADRTYAGELGSGELEAYIDGLISQPVPGGKELP